jgi:hypothetical protein
MGEDDATRGCLSAELVGMHTSMHVIDPADGMRMPVGFSLPLHGAKAPRRMGR